jgi:hypothetical protein
LLSGLTAPASGTRPVLWTTTTSCPQIRCHAVGGARTAAIVEKDGRRAQGVEMGGWQVEPDDVRQILAEVGEHREDLDGAITEDRVEWLFHMLRWGGPLTDVVPAALSRLLADQEDRLAVVGNRVAAGSVGVALAVDAYELGQEEMAGELQSEMVATAGSGDFSYFQPYLEPS